MIKSNKEKDQCEANLTDGGEGTSGLSMSEDKKKVFTMKGKHHSEKTKAKMRKASLGQVMSEEARKKMSIAKTGTKASEETKAKMSAAHSNISDETREKLRNSRRAYLERKRLEDKTQ